MQFGHKGSVLGTRQSLLHDLGDRQRIAATAGTPDPAGGRAGLRSDRCLGGQGQQVKAPVREGEPVEGTILDAPDDILADAVAAIDVELGVQVAADAADGHLGDQFGPP